MKKINTILCLLLIFTLGGCVDKLKTPSEPAENVVMLLHKMGFTQRPTTMLINDKLVILDAEKRGLVFYEVGKETILSPDNAGKHWLHYDGKSLYAFWWLADANKNKYLKARVSNDQGASFSPEIVINTGNGILPELSIASDGKGNIALAYTDERKPRLGVYLNYSNDFGKTWLKQDTRVDVPVITNAMQAVGNIDPASFAKSPKLAFLGSKLVMIWQQVDLLEEGGYVLRLVSKVSNDYGQTWGLETDILREPNINPIEFTVFNRDEQMYVFAMIPSEGKGFTGFYNTDASSTQWLEIKNTALGKEFDKKLISIIKGVFSGDNLVLAFTSDSKNTSEPQEKVSVNVATLSTKTHQWISPARQLDADKGHNLTKSTMPDLINTSSAGVIVVWEDYRSLVPSIYMDISKDNGITWLPTPQPLTTPGLSVAKEPSLLLSKDKLYLMYFSVVLAGDPSGTRVYQEFTRQADGAFNFPVINIQKLSTEELKAKLIDRVNKFWSLREEKKWAETWDYMEPVYRTRFDKNQWLSQQGKLSFSKSVADESKVVITGNLAFVDMNLEVGVNQHMSTEGVVESALPEVKTVPTTWGWFYDDWYFIPNSTLFSKHLEY